MRKTYSVLLNTLGQLKSKQFLLSAYKMRGPLIR